MTRSGSAWPELPWRDWQPTLSTLHMWLQIVGKVSLALAPPLNHWWHVGLSVTARGVTTGPIPSGEGLFQVDLDFVDHRLTVTDGEPGTFTMALGPQSVASFYAEFMAGLRDRGIDVSIWPRPVEVAEAIPFEEDETHAAYDPRHAEAAWRGLVQVGRVMERFRSGFIGKQSPVLLWWGSLDLAVSRFSGRPAPRHPGGIPNCADWVMVEAAAAEEFTAGFWPGGSAGPAFFAYTYPEPPGFREASIKPPEAVFDPRVGEFLLPYEAVMHAPDPDAALLEFLESTYAAGADLAGWDRHALEPALMPDCPPRGAWSLRA